MSKEQFGIFEGWYMKHQIEDRVFAFIVSFHLDEVGEGYGCVQFISTEGSYVKMYGLDVCESRLDGFDVQMGESRFSEDGIQARIDFDGLKVVCDVRYGDLTPLESPIMGPFRHIKGLECSHEILSLTHRMCGYLELNDERLDVSQGVGYIEKDSGRSFPKAYMWTQCNFQYRGDHSIVAAVARVPIGKFGFTGVICEVYYRGISYRMATYKGARVKAYSEHKVVIYQGRRSLCIERMEGQGETCGKNHKLLAPFEGQMSEEIQESPACKMRYTFYDKGQKCFDIVSEQGSYENVCLY